MSSHPDDEPVANPRRTQVDGDAAPSTTDSERAGEHDPHDQPWRKVARDVREAVESADGPLES